MTMKLNNPIKVLYKPLMNLPTPLNISYWWNLGSLMGMILAMQILSGFFLSMHYTSNISSTFENTLMILRNINNGWIMRTFHMNGASLFFICVYSHLLRGIYYMAYKNSMVWTSGVIMLLALMGVSFLGYVLPWGQMSFWGATVITNLMSAIPILGEKMVIWVWGGFSVDAPTLTRFFSLHFILPFVIMSLMMIHLMLLHLKGSNNPMGMNSNLEKVPFHPFFSQKDIMGAWIVILVVLLINFYNPYVFSDVENFIPANPLSTPPHIQPEWYFLFAYAVLRSIPNKLGGVIGLVMAVSVFFGFPVFCYNSTNSTSFNLKEKMLFFALINTLILLTWIGAKPVETPFILFGQTMTIMFFLTLGFIFFNKK